MINKIKNILKASFPDFILRDGRPINDLLIKPSAAINEFYETEKINFLEKSFLKNYQKMTLEEMDLSVSNYLNTFRRLGRFSLTTVRVYLSQRTDIVFDKNKGSFQDTNGKKFIPRFDFSVPVEALIFDNAISKYYIDIPIISEEPFGEEYLVKSGSINTYVGSNPFVDYVVNINDGILVDIQESNTELYNRITENGILLNNNRSNYFTNLLLQTFPDIKKFMTVGTGHELMKRDLTFNSIDINLALENYNFYRKKIKSKIDNANTLYQGLLFNIDIENLDNPDLLLSLQELKETSQNSYNAIVYKDKNAASVSSLLFQDLFYLYSGITDLSSNDWFVGENNSKWNKGSSFINFTNTFDGGINIKGNEISEPRLANKDSGLVLYKEIGDPRNSEYILDFVIEDFNNNDDTSRTLSRTISNTNPFYFTLLKKGTKDQTDIRCSTYDGYGLMIKKSINSTTPNVFIIDGSPAVGQVAFEEEILQNNSERILAAKSIPIAQGVKYTCIMQVNEGYGIKAIFKNEFNAEIGVITVGSGNIDAEYTVTYNTLESNQEILRDSFVSSPTNPPRKFKFINITNDDDYCSSFLDLSFTVASVVNMERLNNRIITLDPNSPLIIFQDFRNVVVGDQIEIGKIKYLITNVYNKDQIEVDKDLPTFKAGGESGLIWRSLRYNIDYSIPNNPFFDKLIVLNTGVTYISNIIGSSNLSNCKLSFLYLNKLGNNIETILNWTDINANNMVVYNASTDPVPSKLNNVVLFDKVITNTDYFYSSTSTTKYQAVYFTQAGYNKIKSDYIRFKVGSTLPYLKKKNDFKQCYYLPVPYPSGILKVTYLDAVKAKTTGYVYTKNTHYEVVNDVITDILVNPTYFSLFNDAVTIDAEVIGTGGNVEITAMASSKSTNKLYITTGAISTTDYFTVILNNERYFIKNIDLNSLNSPFSDKKIEITLDRVTPLFENNSINLRKKASFETDTNYLRFGYRYDIENKQNSTNLWEDSLTLEIKTSSKTLISGDDYEIEKSLNQLTSYYISSEILDISTFDPSDFLTFFYSYRVVLEERKSDLLSEFKPLSNGSYLGIGFKTVNNGSWKILSLKARKLLDRYSIFLNEFYIGNKSVSNEDRLKIDLTTYSINTNASTAPLNGSKVCIYNYEFNTWELLYENNSSNIDNSNVILQYYDGPGAEDRQFDFGYWDGSNFISINENFYPTSYVNKAGNLYLLIASRGKNEKMFSGSIVFGEAKLFLEYINVLWQRKLGVHLGNKVDILTSSFSNFKTDNINIAVTQPTKKIIIDSRFSKPIIKINSIVDASSGLGLNFELINNNEYLRFSTKEDLHINLSNIITSGNYIINYDYYPHIQNKQDFIDSLNSHVDCLIKQFAPCFTKINIGYYGTIDVNATKNEIYNYVRFNNTIDVNYIRGLVESAGSILTTSVNNLPYVSLEEYDYLTNAINKSIYSIYSLKSEKYFEINKEDINLVKIK